MGATPVPSHTCTALYSLQSLLENTVDSDPGLGLSTSLWTGSHSHTQTAGRASHLAAPPQSPGGCSGRRSQALLQPQGPPVTMQRERVSPNPPDPDQPPRCMGGRLPSVPKWIASPSPGKLASASQRDGSLGTRKNPSLLQLAVLSPHL